MNNKDSDTMQKMYVFIIAVLYNMKCKVLRSPSYCCLLPLLKRSSKHYPNCIGIGRDNEGLPILESVFPTMGIFQGHPNQLQLCEEPVRLEFESQYIANTLLVNGKRNVLA